MDIRLAAQRERALTVPRIAGLHRYAQSRPLYVLLVWSGLACGFLAARVWLTQSLAHTWLVLNLCLAWVPYLCSLWADGWHTGAARRSGWLLLIPGGLWILFLPNAPYIITDLIHLPNTATEQLWYDAGLVTAFAWAGLLLGASSLHVMQSIVRARAGGLAAEFFAIGACGLAGVGVYIGRFLRFHSWHALTDPRDVLSATVSALGEPHGVARAIGATIMFAALTFATYLTIVPARGRVVADPALR